MASSSMINDSTHSTPFKLKGDIDDRTRKESRALPNNPHNNTPPTPNDSQRPGGGDAIWKSKPPILYPKFALFFALFTFCDTGLMYCRPQHILLQPAAQHWQPPSSSQGSSDRRLALPLTTSSPLASPLWTSRIRQVFSPIRHHTVFSIR